ncbi:MAG TPA: STAS domain-containing protein [Acidimicrobiales bacterium]|jgi:anti-anti-sigma factor|nr:STAS domain-containing protein [Acidimicrobiales bacterium]
MTSTTLEPEGDVIVRVAGELDLSNIAQFLVVLDEAIDAEPAAIELDLRSLVFMDSSGVGAYVHAFRRARAKNVPLRIGERSPAVDRVLELSGVEEALADEGGGGGKRRNA